MTTQTSINHSKDQQDDELITSDSQGQEICLDKDVKDKGQGHHRIRTKITGVHDMKNASNERAKDWLNSDSSCISETNLYHIFKKKDLQHPAPFSVAISNSEIPNGGTMNDYHTEILSITAVDVLNSEVPKFHHFTCLSIDQASSHSGSPELPVHGSCSDSQITIQVMRHHTSLQSLDEFQ